MPGTMILDSTITCPQCGHVKGEIMPTDACQWFYECERCKTVLRPKAGDCCVFCSYGTNKCPPMQGLRGSCCSGRSSNSADLILSGLYMLNAVFFWVPELAA